MAKPAKYVHSYANISACWKYRYSLEREWRGSHDPKNWRWLGGKDANGEPYGEPKDCVFVMLNPSTADDSIDDPTIRRCVGFARSWNFERLTVVNLYAYRATKPADLFAFEKAGGDVIGDNNLEIIRDVAQRSGLIVCAWGANADAYHAEEVRGWMHGKPHFALGFTKEGHPRHPLYAPSNSALVPMKL